MISNKEINILKKELNLEIDNKTVEKLNKWKESFIEYNSHTNLMSKNDINVLFEKHVFDSLAIYKWNKFLEHNKILDVGCGGGFPSVILAICFPNLNIIANDSRIKKINFIKDIKEKLELNNLEILYSRIEETKPLNVDLIVSRAVGKMVNVFELSKKHLLKNGDFLIYKSKLADDEIKIFKEKYKNSKIKTIDYNLPLQENIKRTLIIVN